MLAVLIVTSIIVAAVSAAFSVIAVFFPGLIVRDGVTSHTARMLAFYGVARSASLLLIILWAGFRADGTAMIWLGTLSGVIQLADAAVSATSRDPLKIGGPLGLGIIQLVVVLLAMWFV